MGKLASKLIINPLTNENFWIFEVFSVFFILFLILYLFKRLIKNNRTHHNSSWKEKVDKVILLPIIVIFWILAISYVLKIITNHFGFLMISRSVELLSEAFIVSCLAWLLLRWKREIQYVLTAKREETRHMIDPGMVQILGRLASVLILFITGVIILQIFGVNVLPLIAFGGVGAAAIGFSGKDVIANFFGGLMLYITRPFVIGDYIVLVERNIEGVVESIGWYLTLIRDKEKRAAYLPNSIFSTVLVINSSQATHKKLETSIRLNYADFPKLSPIIEAIEKMLLSHTSIDKSQPVQVFFDKFSEYALQIQVEAYSLKTEYKEFLTLKNEILMNIKKIITSFEATMPFPTSQICLSINKKEDIKYTQTD